MSNFDEIKSLNLFGGNEGENKNEEAIGGEMIGTVDAKGKPLDSILEMLSQMRDPSTDDADDDFDNDDNVMDADDYHNKACDMPWDNRVDKKTHINGVAPTVLAKPMPLTTCDGAAVIILWSQQMG